MRVDVDLRPGDLLTPQMAAVRRALDARLAELRAGNDANLSDADTARQRGRIAEIKDWLALWEPATPDLEIEPSA